VLLTNLANRVQPLIRYDLGDSITRLDQPCACGSALPVIRVEGRCDDTIRLCDSNGASVQLLPLALTTVLEDDAGVFRFQLLQLESTALLLRLDPSGLDSNAEERCRQALARFLQAHGVPNVSVEVQRCALARDASSGKLRRIRAKDHHHLRLWMQHNEAQNPESRSR
jgi:phenylacetate-coenzyme A ligase PaaK-like adenylate-forming protein